jgi:hypothetical protein
VLWVAGCASYENRILEPRRLFEQGRYDQAISDLQKLVDRNDNDQLLYLMDLGLVQHEAGRYADAIKTFLRADQLAEIKDYTSLTLEAASIMLSDEVKGYKGEDFEKILIDVYLAIDYTMLHNSDDALVQCRIVNHKLDMMISLGQLPYERNRFAKYLSASLFESKGELNDSLVDYRQLQEWAGNLPYLGAPLLRLTTEMADPERFAEFRKDYPDVNNYKLGKDQGEVILLLEQGKAPIKKPSPQFRLLPKFFKRFYNSDYVFLRDAGGAGEARSYTFYDIEATAIRDLDHKTGTIVAKKLAGYALKEAAAYGVAKATHSELAGALTSIMLHATDKADLRSWTTLPAHLQIARLTLPAGRHNLVLDMVNHYASRSPGVKTFEGVEVKPGKIVFFNYRTPD